MTPTLTLVVYMAVLTWLTYIGGSLIRIKVWTWQGILCGVGNRDNLPEATPIAGRADRTARNTLENFVLFAAIALVAHVAGVADPQVAQGATLFFWARVIYIAVYYAGVIWLRTVVWAAGVVGLIMMIVPLLK
jgi:uncharacterized MAPEG superfamily protein